jgi:hypothetical protein
MQPTTTIIQTIQPTIIAKVTTQPTITAKITTQPTVSMNGGTINVPTSIEKTESPSVSIGGVPIDIDVEESIIDQAVRYASSLFSGYFIVGK